MFEKNILLTLIGFVIQPNKASVMVVIPQSYVLAHGHTYMHTHTHNLCTYAYTQNTYNTYMYTCIHMHTHTYTRHVQINPPGSGMFFGAAQTGFTIGELLRLFCTSLQDQIKHRTYFYKSATLVQEGMLVVNNAGLTGDPASAKVEIDRRMLDFCVGLDTEFSEIVEGSHLYYPKTKFEQVS